MSRKKIEMILNIHSASTKPLYDVLDGIPDEQANWRPAPDSRSINEIMRHLIRVDNSFLKKLGQEIKTHDPGDSSSSIILNALKNVHMQIRSLVNNCADDSDLFKKSNLTEVKGSDTIKEHILHSCQHNLYHLAQTIYLRRALDRNWESPINDWDKATRLIANYLAD